MNSLQFKPLKPWVGFEETSRKRDYRFDKTTFMLDIERTLYFSLTYVIWRD